MGNSAARDRRRVAVEERRQKALSLRCAGLGLASIAQNLDLSVTRVHELIDEAIKAIPQEAAEQLRQIEIERLNALTVAGWQKAREGDPNAIRALVTVIDRRCKLLGLDVPARLELTGKDGGPVALSLDDIDAALATANANAVPAVLGAAVTVVDPIASEPVVPNDDGSDDGDD